MTWPPGPPGTLGHLHVLLALAVALAYAAVPFTPLRHLPLHRNTRVCAVLLFASCAVTALASAAGFCAGSGWMLAAGVVQLVSLVGFVYTLCRQWAYTRAHRKRLQCLRAHERGGDEPAQAAGEPPW